MTSLSLRATFAYGVNMGAILDQGSEKLQVAPSLEDPDLALFVGFMIRTAPFPSEAPLDRARRGRIRVRGAALWVAIAAWICGPQTSLAQDAGSSATSMRKRPPESAATTSRDAGARAGFSDPSSADWELVYNDEGVRVYRRRDTGSDALEMRAEAVIAAPFRNVLSVLQDGDKHDEWVPRCAVSRVLRQEGSIDSGRFMLQLYQRFETPWPVWDRDVVVEMRGRADLQRGIARVNYRNVRTKKPPVPTRVLRMPKLRGRYRLSRLGASRTRVQYTVESELGGSIPTWLIRWVSDKAPGEALVNLRQRLKALGR